MVKEIFMVMMKGQHVALTTDHWSSISNTTLMAVTAHFIDDDWNLVSLSLGCTEHAGETTAVEFEKEIDSALNMYKLKMSSW